MGIDFGRDVCGDDEAASAREWLVANGLGGYASGTVGGSLTRSYHGYLVAALQPPGGRTLLLAKCDESCTYLGVTYDLATNHWRSGTTAPNGYRLLERFFLDGTTPVWQFAFGGALVEKRLTLQPDANVALVRYSVMRAVGPVAFEVRAIADYRDHNATSSGGLALPAVALEDEAVTVRFAGSDVALYLRSDRCVPSPASDWYRDYDLVRERERGLPDRDDHVHAATFAFSLEPGEAAHLWAGTPDVRFSDAAAPWAERAAREAALLAKVRVRDGTHAQLMLAADQFIVARASPANPDGKTVIAGYHWFTDWGRDTAISLPGLALATGRPEVARAILETFARYVDGGMLPNVFPDRGETPQYNTVDAALWYVEAVRAYVEAAGLDSAFETLYGACVAIVDGYRRGTRYGIHMDPSDALIAAGEAGVQLTWMDAKYGDTVVTPRIGKPVEINALWYNALCTLSDLGRRRGIAETEYATLARRVRAGFARFVLPDRRGLADVLDGPDGDDATLRPNQIFAVSLTHSPLDPAAARAVVDVCARELVTSHGLRTLSPRDSHYIGRYAGTREERDGAYHQGTVWPWLLGAFAGAHAATYGDSAVARSFLDPLLRSLGAAGLGTVGEIADGDAPFAWSGAIAQAWSVAELLRACEALVE
jgi:predicted glycogen debranching enzyme